MCRYSPMCGHPSLPETEGFWTVKESEKVAVTRGFKIAATKLQKADWESKLLEIEVKEPPPEE